MFREKEICNAIRTAYLYLFPDKKERKRALSRLNMELVAQSVRYRGESVLAYQTAGNHECSLNYYGPELFPQRGFCIYQKTIQSHSTQVDASCIRELWLFRLCATRGRVIKLFGIDRTCYSISSSLSSPKRLATAVRQHGEKRQPSRKGQAETARQRRKAGSNVRLGSLACVVW